MSVTMRMDGRGGKTYSFCAWYSFKHVVLNRPAEPRAFTPASAAAATYIASTIAAGELIVIEVVTVAEVDAVEQIARRPRECRRLPRSGPTSPSAKWIIGVPAHQCRQVEGNR